MITACGQMIATTIDDADSAWNAVERLADRAADAHADLLILPETTYPAYWLESAERYMRIDVLRTPTVLERLSGVAARRRLWLVVGFVEEAAGLLFNSAAVFDRAGTLIGVARKNFLWDCDNRWFSPGRELTVLDTEFGPMGVMICADGRPPEIAATLAARGAAFIVVPTAWVNGRAFTGNFTNAQADFLIRARAIEFALPFACCSKSGHEDRNLEYVGQSRLVSKTGEIIASAPIEGEHLVLGEIRPSTPRPAALSADTRARLMSTAPPYRAAIPGGPCEIPLHADADTIAAAVAGAGGRAAAIDVADLHSFSTARCHALDGIQVLIARGSTEIDDAVVRARATENRIYVILADQAVRSITDPAGRQVWRTGDPGTSTSIELGRADDKRFTPQTDLWRQRHVSAYDL